MLTAYEKDEHFATYATERNPSFSANCNVLSALLHTPESELYTSSIEKAVKFLCEYWWESDGFIRDKWVPLPKTMK